MSPGPLLATEFRFHFVFSRLSGVLVESMRARNAQKARLRFSTVLGNRHVSARADKLHLRPGFRVFSSLTSPYRLQIVVTRRLSVKDMTDPVAPVTARTGRIGYLTSARMTRSLTSSLTVTNDSMPMLGPHGLALLSRLPRVHLRGFSSVCP